jgi:hypothetical protein
MAADLDGAHQATLGADKNDDTKGFVAEMRHIGVTPPVPVVLCESVVLGLTDAPISHQR